MTATQEILFGVTGQTLAVEIDRAITSVTSATVWPLGTDDTSTAEVATTGSAAVDATTEALTAAAGTGQANRARLTVASTTGFVTGRRYLIAGAGRAELVEIAAVETNAYLHLRHPLVNAYAIGATVSGANRATISVLDAWAALLEKLSPTANPNPSYRVRWELVLSDPTETAIEYRNFDLVRYPSRAPVNGLDIDHAFPGWLDSLPPDHRNDQGRALIADAVRQVRLDLYGRGIADQALRNHEAFSALVTSRAIWGGVAANGLRGADVAQALTVAQDDYDRRLAGLVDTPVLALDTTGSGGAVVKARAERFLRR